MVFKIDFVGGDAVAWQKTEKGVEATRAKKHRPRFYIEGDKSDLHRSRPWLTRQRGVHSTCFETWKPTLSKPEKEVLRVDAQTEDGLKSAVNKLKKSFGRSKFRFYNVGISPQFRYCLQERECPRPSQKLDKVHLDLERRYLANEDLSRLKIDGEKAGNNEEQALRQLRLYWETNSPDIVLVSRGDLLKLIDEKQSEHGINFSLGRIDKFQELASGNTVSSYGKRQHKAARYNIPGRILIDKSNSFMLGEATLEGLWDLVERSFRPLQELSWGSIGRLLTSIEIRRAYLEENTLTPWKNWEPETPKPASTMHEADRGGFIFNPEPRIHKDVYEADFASLFPNIMRYKNISPETVCCSCCDNEKVPELGYSICEKKDGFIGRVLAPLIDDRQEMKEKLREGGLSESEEKYLQGSADAIKWILVSCFGYMGHAHASYGAIECHQAIQAFDRDIMLQAKEKLEGAGYSIAHGIIDSIWVQAGDKAEPFEEKCREISEDIGIELEPEHRFEWCAFVPRSSSEARISTLNRYFGKKADGGFKTAGIEVEQSSVCKFIKDSQMEMIEALDKRLEADDVLEVVQDRAERLESGKVPCSKLVKTRKVSKTVDEYSVENRSFSALKRASKHGVDFKPGQKVNFVVRDDSADPLGRTRLEFEVSDRDKYDAEHYEAELVRAAESVLSPLGLDREEVRREIEGGEIVHLDQF